jgi:SAM-dependent methyltransferase
MTAFDAPVNWEHRLKHNAGVRGVGHTDLGAQYNLWLDQVRRTIFHRAIYSLQPDWSGTRVLDVGSGTGFYMRLWKHAGVSAVTGSDLTGIAVSRLLETFPTQEILRLDIGAPFSPFFVEELGRFQAISAYDVMFHIVDDARYERAIRNVSALLSPGGVFFFSDLFLHGETLRGERVVFRTLKDVTHILAAAGFEIVRRFPMFVIMAQPLDTSSVSGRFLWKLLTYPMRKSEAFGFLVGGSLAPIELVLTKILRESPTTEVMVCRKVKS